MGVLAFWRLRNIRKDVEEMQTEMSRSSQESDIVVKFMHDIVGDIASGADKRKIYDIILKTVTSGCNATSACIYEQMPNGKLVAVKMTGAFPPQRPIPPFALANIESRTDFLAKILRGEELDAHEGIIGEVARTKKPIFIANARVDYRVVKHLDASLAISSMMVVPLVFRDEFFGVLALANPTSGGSFSASDFSVIKAIGDQASLSLSNIQTFTNIVEKNRLDYDLKLASSVQQYLMPEKLPSIEGFEFASKYIPQQKIGGDFFDVFKLSEHKVGLVIGDVSGKGIAAAIIMGLAQTNLRYIAKMYDKPSEALKALNKEMFMSVRLDMFITMIYATLDLQTGKIMMARAGHEKPLVYSKEKESAFFLKSKGSAVGMYAPELFDKTISDLEDTFNVNDVLVLYTDGITEATNPDGDEFTTERLRSVLAESASLSSADLCERITQKVFSFAERQGFIDDDFTLLTIKRIK